MLSESQIKFDFNTDVVWLFETKNGSGTRHLKCILIHSPVCILPSPFGFIHDHIRRVDAVSRQGLS